MEKVLTKGDSGALKGVAVLLMVFHHCFRSKAKFAAYSLIFTPFHVKTIIHLAHWAKICVPIFAFVSGYGLIYVYKKMENPSPGEVFHWIKKRLISTLSGFWFVAGASYVVLYLFGRLNLSKWGDNNFKRILLASIDCLGLSDLLGTNTLRGAWWYMGAAIIFIILLPLLAWILGKWKLGGLVCIGLLSAVPRITGIGFPGGTNAFSFLTAFILGVLSQEYHIFNWFHCLHLVKNEKINDLLKFCLTAAGIAFGIWSYSKIPLKVFWEYHYAIVPFVLILFLVEYVFRLKKVRNVFEYFGKYSLDIWLLHTFVRDYLARYVWNVKYFLLVPVVITLISLVLGIIVEAAKKYSGYNKMIHYFIKK